MLYRQKAERRRLRKYQKRLKKHISNPDILFSTPIKNKKRIKREERRKSMMFLERLKTVGKSMEDSDNDSSSSEESEDSEQENKNPRNRGISLPISNIEIAISTSEKEEEEKSPSPQRKESKQKKSKSAPIPNMTLSPDVGFTEQGVHPSLLENANRFEHDDFQQSQFTEDDIYEPLIVSSTATATTAITSMATEMFPVSANTQTTTITTRIIKPAESEREK